MQRRFALRVLEARDDTNNAGRLRAVALACWLSLPAAVGCGDDATGAASNPQGLPPPTAAAGTGAPTPMMTNEASPAANQGPATSMTNMGPASPATEQQSTEPAAEVETPANPSTNPSTTEEVAEPETTETQNMPQMPATEGALIRGPEPTAESATQRGPYEVGEITDGFRDGPDFRDATIYYPVDAEPPFAMIVFCPGWLGTQASDRPWGPFMASHGIVFMNIDTNTIGDSVQVRTEAEMDALESLKAEHTRSGSPLEGKLDLERAGLMGWSMGGGAAWLNGTANPEIKSIVTLAGHNSTAGGARRNDTLSVPTLMLAGTADTAILGLGMSQPMYEVIPESTPKILYEVRGADHFDFNNPAYMDGIPARYALSWQKVFLEGDMRYYPFLLVEGPMASDFRSNLE